MILSFLSSVINVMSINSLNFPLLLGHSLMHLFLFYCVGYDLVVWAVSSAYSLHQQADQGGQDGAGRCHQVWIQYLADFLGLNSRVFLLNLVKLFICFHKYIILTWPIYFQASDVRKFCFPDFCFYKTALY